MFLFSGQSILFSNNDYLLPALFFVSDKSMLLLGANRKCPEHPRLSDLSLLHDKMEKNNRQGKEDKTTNPPYFRNFFTFMVVGHNRQLYTRFKVFVSTGYMPWSEC